MKKHLIIGLAWLVSCGNPTPPKQSSDAPLQSKPTLPHTAKVQNPRADTMTVDTSAIAQLPPNGLFPFEGAKEATLNSQELQQIEAILFLAVRTYNARRAKQFAKHKQKYPNDTLDKQQFLIDLAQYKRQYVAVINQQGQKEVWVNCFCSVNFDWKQEIVKVLDGGKCFFHLNINLTQEKYYDFAINGPL